MPRILLANELGGGLGHVVRMGQVAAALRRHGATVHIAARRWSLAVLPPGERHAAIPAPGLARSTRGDLNAFNYAELLARVGYSDGAALAEHVAAWRRVVEDADPHLVVSDFAPGALLAARILGLPAATVGTGFALPPRQTPLPSFRPWMTPPLDRMAMHEREVLAAVNAVMESAGAANIGTLADLLHTGRDVLCTFAEFDHYGEHRNQAHQGDLAVGPIFGEAAEDPGGAEALGGGILAYLSPDSPALECLAGAAEGIGLPILAIAPGLSDAEAKARSRTGITVRATTLPLAAVLAASRAVVCHGGMGLVSRALLAGRPLVMVPRNPEQLGTAHRVVAAGYGLILAEHDAGIAMAATVRRAVDQPTLTAAAGAFAERHRGYDPATTADTVAGTLVDYARNFGGTR